MIITVNGKKNEVPEDIQTIAQLLIHLKLDDKVVIVEQNGRIVNKDTHNQTALEENDRFELVHFVGGG